MAYILTNGNYYITVTDTGKTTKTNNIDEAKLFATIGKAQEKIKKAPAKTKNYYIAGLIPLFPTFALIAHYIVASERGIEALRATIIFSMWSIIPYFVYLVSLWYFTGMMRLPAAFVGSVACWGISAWVLIICWIKLH